ncbi:hypothetical protein KO481_42480 [Nocardia sp. NEAU-G5]|uniref:MFS transporter n=1 Tax=Nocardia albiluteola TaxID=2842303 RepID=A0ABS6BF74_9NOCA|nr:hypothetical protein [Nocardia albiluteola]MBU3068171.1 hypothetical protein [Nocardia albiluteola]
MARKKPRPEPTSARSGSATSWTAGGNILTHPGLRGLYLNNTLVSGFMMATEPLLAVLLLRQLHFPPWQYGLAFAAPCVGGFIGSRLASRVVARYGQYRVLRTAGALRVIWLIGLAFISPGVVGLVTVIAVALALPRRLSPALVEPSKAGPSDETPRPAVDSDPSAERA